MQAGYGSQALVEGYGCVAATQWWRVMAVWQSHLGGVLWLYGLRVMVVIPWCSVVAVEC